MAKANGVLPREHTGHSKHPFPTTQEKTLHMDITRWSTPKSDWLYSLQSLQPKMEKLYTVSKNKIRSWHGSDHELFIVKFRLKLKKVRKTTRPFWSDLNQTPYDYAVTVQNRLITFFAAKDREALYSRQKTRPEADCGTYHELLIGKFRLKLKKMRKTNIPFRYDLNQIPMIIQWKWELD